MIDPKISHIIDNLTRYREKGFLETLVITISQASNADHVYIAKLNDDQTAVTTLAYAENGQLTDNISYALTDTPCAHVLQQATYLYVDDLQSQYPNDQRLVNQRIHGYAGYPLKNVDGQALGLIVTLHKGSTTDAAATENLLAMLSIPASFELQRSYSRGQYPREVIIDTLDQGIVLTDENNRIIYCNHAFTEITGYTLDEALGETPNLIKSSVQDKALYYSVRQCLEEQGTWSGEILSRKKSGENYAEWLSLKRFTDTITGKTYHLAIFHEISNPKYAPQQVRLQKHYDLLTDLPNRHLLLERIEQQLLLMEQTDNKTAILFISLDNFRDLNIAMGHKLGDTMLQKIAARLSNNLRQYDTLARYAGDEFVLLLPLLKDISTVEAQAFRILDAIRAPFAVDNKPVEITASIGIVVCPNDANDPLDALAKADQACNHAKASGKNGFKFFTDEMQQRSNHKIFLKNALHRALQEKQLEVYYQPIINLNSRTVEKAEALVRWNHEGQFISPMEFIPIAEEFQMAPELGKLVLERTCLEIKYLEHAGFNDIKISINRSVAEFPSPDSANENWLATLNDLKVDPCKITFEITESILAPENTCFTDYLADLKQAGCSISLDDFGTGYSSLSYLRTFPIDHLKIDRAFVADLEQSEDAQTLVATIIAMAKALGMKTIAEGVENRQQLQQLQSLGCDYIQGFFFSRPVPGNDLLEYIKGFDYQQYVG